MTVRRAAVLGVLAAAAVGGVVVWLVLRGGPVPVDPDVGLRVPPGPHVPKGEIDAGVVVPDGPPEGNEAIAGRVVGADGAGVSGAVVVAERDRAFDATIRGRSGDAGVVPIGAARGARTAVDGSFTITSLAKGVYRVRVEGPGVVPAELRRVVAPATDVALVVARLVRVAGVVVDEGVAAARATVEISGTALAAPRMVVTGADGRFEVGDLPEGTLVVTAWRGARASPAATVARFGAGPWEEVTLALGPATLVTGRVVDERTGAGVEGARVTLLPEVGAARFAIADGQGEYSIEGVAPGSWSVEVEAPGYLPPEPRPLEAAPGMTVKVDAVLIAGAVVAGRVVDGAGVPVTGARVELRGATAGRMVTLSAETLARRLSRGQPQAGSNGRLLPIGELGVLVGPIPYPPPPGARVATAPAGATPSGTPPAAAKDPVAEAVRGFVTDADGRFRIPGVPPGRFVATAVHPDFAEGGADVTVRAASAIDDLVITMRRGAVVAGTVVDSRGVQVLGADVSARVKRGTVALVYTDSEGRYELRGLAGPVTLRAAARGHAAVEAIVDIGAGDDGRTIKQDFRLGSAGGEIAGTVQDALRRPIAAAEVIAQARGGHTSRAASDAFGRFTVRGLPDGPVAVAVRHPDYAPTSLTARTGRDDLAVTLSPAGGIEGQVRDAQTGGPMLAFTLRARGPDGAELTRSFEKGDFTLVPLVPGKWTVTVEARGYATRIVTYDVPAAREPRHPSLAGVRIELRQGGTLAGIVYDEHGELVSGALVQAGLVRATSDSTGRFRLTGVEPGDLTVRATHPQAGQGETTVALRSGDEILTLEVKLAR